MQVALFNDFFGKEEIAQLKKQLSEKNDENFRLSSQVAQLTSTRDLLENELSKRSQIVDEKINELEKATGKIQELEYEIKSLASDFEGRIQI